MWAERAKLFFANTPRRWIATLVLVALFFGVLPVMSLLGTLISGENGPRWFGVVWFIPWALFGCYIIGGVYRRGRRGADRAASRAADRDAEPPI